MEAISFFVLGHIAQSSLGPSSIATRSLKPLHETPLERELLASCNQPRYNSPKDKSGIITTTIANEHVVLITALLSDKFRLAKRAERGGKVVQGQKGCKKYFVI